MTRNPFKCWAAFVFPILALFISGMGGCRAPGHRCDSDNDCSAGFYCSVDDFSFRCEQACNEMIGEGSNGSACEFGSDCESGICDNDEKEASCECLPEGTGGTGGMGGGGSGGMGTGGSGGSGSGECDQCIGVNAAPPSAPPNTATECEGPVGFRCSCVTESGETLPFFLSATGCVF
jgi:hypothetical protein